MNLIYKVKDKPKFGQLIVFAFQQLLAILAATIAVPAIINNTESLKTIIAGHEMSQSAALFGAGVGTLVYLLFTKFKSPVFLGSSFAFIGSMCAAFAGAVSAEMGYAGIVLGAVFAGLVYVVIALIVKFAGVKWIGKLMPPVVIGPTVALIGLSLAGNAVKDSLTTGAIIEFLKNNDQSYLTGNGEYVMGASNWTLLACSLVTLFVIVICSVFGKKMMKLIPFIIGILAGYAVAAILTLIGNETGHDALCVINFSAFSDMQWWPKFTFSHAIGGFGQLNAKYITTIAVAYIPVAFVVFAEHIADHKNLSSIIDSELLEDPGLHRTLLGDGVGSMVGAFFGGCPNTTYGESVGCVAITGNASVVTILATAILAILAAFCAPFVTFLSTIPSCVMGGVCITLYGFIAVSGLKMLQGVDLGNNRNLFVVSVILITGIGGMALSIQGIVLTKIAVALILGIIVNAILGRKDKQAA